MNEPPLKERVASRKFLLMVSILCVATTSLCLPVLGLVTSATLAPLITGGEYVSLILGSFAIYSGANVAQKKFEQTEDVYIKGE